jgi:hypothetical protein
MTATHDWRLSLDADPMTIGKSPTTTSRCLTTRRPATSTPSSSAAARSVRRRPGLLHDTWLNAVRVWYSQRVRHGDKIRIGQARLIFRDLKKRDRGRTETEDAPPSLTPASGGTVRVAETTPANLKVTTPHDLRVAELLLAQR